MVDAFAARLLLCQGDEYLVPGTISTALSSEFRPRGAPPPAPRGWPCDGCPGWLPLRPLVPPSEDHYCTVLVYSSRSTAAAALPKACQ